MVCGMELRHFLEKLEVSGSFFLYASDVTKMCVTICGTCRLRE